MQNWDVWANKPFIITEFYTKAEDSGLTNVTGAGWKVRTQKDRGITLRKLHHKPARIEQLRWLELVQISGQ